MKNEHVTNEEFNSVVHRIDESISRLEVSVDHLVKGQQEILEAIHVFSGSVDKRFEQVDKRFERLEQRVITIETTMVTKDYLEGRLQHLNFQKV